MNLINPISQLSGHYKIEAFVPGNPKRVVADWFDNLITDHGMNTSSAYDSYQLAYCSVGSGNTPPAFHDVNLASLKKTTSNRVNTQSGLADDYAWWRATYQFNQGQASGTLAEVGIGNNNNGTNLFSRALIKDAQGNPTSITVLPDEILHVTWELRVNALPASTGVINIAGSGLHDYSLGTSYRKAPAGKGYVHFRLYYPYFGAATSGISDDSGGYFSTDYVQGTFKREGVFIASVNAANFPTGIKKLKFDWLDFSGGSQEATATFDPPIMKTSNDSLTLNVSVSWARA